jgi:hypothetical protein
MRISALELRLGMSVVGMNGRHVGRVKQVRGTNFLIDRRFRRDVYVPLAAIQRIIAEDHPASLFVALDVTAQKADRIAWPSGAAACTPRRLSIGTSNDA